jgi:hypothetical protein
MAINRNSTLVVLAVFFLHSTSALSTPLHDPKNKGVIAWPDNTTITVYVPADPDGLGRDKGVKDGVESWNNDPVLKGKGIKIETMTGTPPAGAKNAVGVQWVSGTIGPDQRFGEGGPSYSTKGANTSTGGTIKVSRDTTQVTPEMAKNLGIHEMGHVLGMDDTNKLGAAMNPDFSKDSILTVTATDSAELKAVYTANGNDTKSDFHSFVSPGIGGYEYRYTLSWLDGGHLGLFQVDGGDSAVLNAFAPTGWEIDPGVGSDVLLDSDPKGIERLITYRVADELSYLSSVNLELSFGFTSDAPPGPGEVFANGRITALTPVPEPTTNVLLLSGLALAALLGRKFRRLQQLS